jgi:hypothetical protein
VLQLAGGEFVAGGTLDEGDHGPAVRDDVIAGIQSAAVTSAPASSWRRRPATRTHGGSSRAAG